MARTACNVYLLQAHSNKAFELCAERAFELRSRRLRDEEEHPHGVQICMRGGPSCHLQHSSSLMELCRNDTCHAVSSLQNKQQHDVRS